MTKLTAYFLSIFVGLGCLMKILATVSPKITTHPPTEIAYKIGERVDLPCKAVGDPAPKYKWTKNGEELRSDINMTIIDGIVTIEYPNQKHDGIYQCIATNPHGMAVSVKAKLQLAVLEQFPALIGEPPVHEPVIRTSFTLTCKPPKSYPKGTIHWALADQANHLSKIGLYEVQKFPDSFFNQIRADGRIATDYNGSLWFANVEAGDDQLYLCMLYNSKLRIYIQGDEQRVKPKSAPTGGFSQRHVPAQLVWHSQTPNVVAQGSTAYMKCIFSGYPTPLVTWERVGGLMPTKVQYPSKSGGLELVIPSVQLDDAGSYTCKATNSYNQALVTKSFVLEVQSEPYFKNPPVDVSVLENEDAEFNCNAGGKPQATITWSLNGKLLSDLEPDSRRTLSTDQTTLRIAGVQASDAMILTCNASNAYGFAIFNVALRVVGDQKMLTNASTNNLIIIFVIIGSALIALAVILAIIFIGRKCRAYRKEDYIQPDHILLKNHSYTSLRSRRCNNEKIGTSDPKNERNIIISNQHNNLNDGALKTGNQLLYDNDKTIVTDGNIDYSIEIHELLQTQSTISQPIRLRTFQGHYEVILADYNYMKNSFDAQQDSNESYSVRGFVSTVLTNTPLRSENTDLSENVYTELPL